MKFKDTDIFIYTVRFSNYYNNYLKNQFLRNYGQIIETPGHASFFFSFKNSL